MSELHQYGEIVRSRYQIVNVLGEGGIGITYGAQDLQTGDRVALKALSFRRMHDWKILELFEREAKVLAQLNHPAIASYLDYFQIDTESDRGFYIVQELVEGRSLFQAIADGWHGSEKDVQAIAMQVLEILIYLHELKPPVIHRDIKPQNLIMQTDGKIMLVDFGAVQDTYRNTQIGGSTVVGTYGYMPPEQFRGKAVPATDLYALGATILFLLTGRSPADLPEQKLKINFRGSVNISEHFAKWLDKMIEPAIEDRFNNARQALNSLQTQGQDAAYSDEEIQRILKQANYQPATRTSYNLANTLASNYARPAATYQYPKPLGSRIHLQKTEDLLKIDIPAAGVTGEGAGLLFFSLFWNGFLIVWTSMALRAGIFALFSIPFWVIGVGLTYVGLTVVFGKISLMIGDRTFTIDWDILGVKRHVQGRTQDLRQVEMKSSYEVNGQPVMQLCLQQGIYAHKFGSGLTRPEKDWLLQEINDFLNLWRSRH